MLPASLAAWVPLFIATPTSAWARAGASLVPSPVMATSLPLSCSPLMNDIFFSGVASAMKSSTPASSAMAAAVRGLSPVIITVLMPMARNRAKRSRMPSLTMSLRWMTPRARAPSHTASGVPPESPISPATRSSSGGSAAPWASRCRATASTAPLRICRPSRSQPLMRVWAVKGMKVAPSSVRSRPRRSNCCTTRAQIDRPSGVSSASDASWAASARSSRLTPGAGMNSDATRLPRVMVPVLSSSSEFTSPAASTARPLVAITFLRRSRSMPAMPMAESSPPMVVGMRQTRSATTAVAESVTPE